MLLLKTSEGDFYTSPEKALTEIDPDWRNYNGLIIVGSHSPDKEDAELKIQKIKEARENKTPFLGICYGFQLMVIEWVRNAANLPMANSTEIDPNTPNPVIVKMNERHTGIRPVTWFDGSVSYETFWHNYAMNPYYLRYFPEELWDVSFGEHAIVMIKLRDRSFFVGVQFHPEYESSREKPHKLLREFIEVCKNSK